MSEVAVQEPDRSQGGERSADSSDWVIADLHLTDEGDRLTPHFLEWLGTVPLTDSLWILGDLFDYWLGKPHLESPGFAGVFNALQARSERGGFTAIVPGNRDFLLGRPFELRTGAHVLKPGVRLERGSHPWLFLHGDELCTRDVGYQRLRWWLRSRGVRTLLRCLPTFAKRAMARKIRRASKRAVPNKPMESVQMQPDAAQCALRANRAQFLVCGHAHRFEDRPLEPDGRWFVLDAFGGGGHDVLLLGADGEWAWKASRPSPPQG